MGELILAGLAAVLLYAGSCLLLPYARCRVCDGTGKKGPAGLKRFRLCWWCKGTGRRLRIGRRLWNRARRAHRDGR